MTRDLRTMPHDELMAFTSTLRSLDWRKLRTKDFERIANFIDSDGCTIVPDFFYECCVMHDWWYGTHRYLDGSPISRLNADKNFRVFMQRRSRFGKWSPMAWWRYVGLRIAGGKRWED